ncbi:MAG: LLM class flavin-dependent oxidoreductase [Halobacteriota archaeon]
MPDLKHGIVLPNWEVDGDTERLVEYAVAAEAAGWDGVFLADHLAMSGEDGPPPFPDPWITLAGIAARTEKLRLVSWVTPIPRRQPWQVARDLATLDRLSDGRVILGTGLGRAFDYTTFGTPYEPKLLGRRYDEALDVITGLWTGEPFSYEGEHFTVDEAVMQPRPVQEPRIPIIVGGLWPNKQPFHRGARWDGMIPHYRGDGIIPAEGLDPDETGDQDLPARTVLRMATVNGASLFEGSWGPIEPGRVARLLVLDATTDNLAGVEDPVRAVVRRAEPTDIETVYFGASG